MDLELAPIAQCDVDDVRKSIDGIIEKALGLPSIHSLRELLVREPGLSAQDINPQATQDSLDIEDNDEEAA
jgi:hypothetical protein